MPMSEYASAEVIVQSLSSGNSLSIVMPAGTGKTELVADVAAKVSKLNKRCLVLTHTHAGIEALRRRTRMRNLTSEVCEVRTIDSWCHDLIRAFPKHSRYDAPKEPDWKNDAIEYHRAGKIALLAMQIQSLVQRS